MPRDRQKKYRSWEPLGGGRQVKASTELVETSMSLFGFRKVAATPGQPHISFLLTAQGRECHGFPTGPLEKVQQGSSRIKYSRLSVSACPSCPGTRSSIPSNGPQAPPPLTQRRVAMGLWRKAFPSFWPGTKGVTLATVLR